jgi:hypothetical protein
MSNNICRTLEMKSPAGTTLCYACSLPCSGVHMVQFPAGEILWFSSLCCVQTGSRSLGLLGNRCLCLICENMTLMVCPDRHEGIQWRYHVQTLEDNHSVCQRMGKTPWFKRPNLTLAEVILLTYFCMCEFLQSNAMMELCQFNSYNFCQEVCTKPFECPNQVGGSQKVV